MAISLFYVDSQNHWKRFDGFYLETMDDAFKEAEMNEGIDEFAIVAGRMVVAYSKNAPLTDLMLILSRVTSAN